MDRVCNKQPGADVVKPGTYTEMDASTQNSGKGTQHHITSTYTANLSDDQTARVDLDKEVHVPQEGTSDVKHHGENKYITETVRNLKPQWREDNNTERKH